MAERGYQRRTLVLSAALAAVLPLAACESRSHRPAQSAVTAPRDAADSRIGVLTLPAESDSRSCTASVVDSPRRNLIVTAAHCVYQPGVGPVSGLAFSPGYRDGDSPYGSWPVDQITVDQHWQDDGDPEYDVAFLTVGPLNGRRIEDVVGGNRLGINRGFDLPVTVTGYPNESDQPISCAIRTTARSSTQERFDCGGFTDGTSGSPWVTGTDPATGVGTLVGVIGGYQEGGDTADTSYSVSFDDRVAAVYQRAVS
ncbi:trypsin-like serine peptidase [Kitasatospora sp. NPDC052896]|uniref:trypsin-like serine peptidase n=1 Tax=Kitasatospora sp. NPDC052896 TaxID=3364061 RepID=UPI0037C8084E